MRYYKTDEQVLNKWTVVFPTDDDGCGVYLGLSDDVQESVNQFEYTCIPLTLREEREWLGNRVPLQQVPDRIRERAEARLNG